MQGLDCDGGIDRTATMALHNSRKTSPFDAGVLRALLTGSVRLQQRLHAAQLADTDTCPFCREEPETLEHCFWRCPCWDHIRRQFDIPAADARNEWPRCTRECGIFLERDEVLRANDALEEEEAAADAMIQEWCLAADTSAGFEGEHWSGVRTTVWTDGASRNNSDSRICRAGCGAYYAPDHPLNLSCILPGRVQSNQRAELLAIVLALRRDARQLDIRTDSKYCWAGAVSWAKWAAQGWHGSNRDLWQRFSAAMQSRPPGSVLFTKVKGHASQADVAAGRTLAEDKAGNDAADTLAGAGADAHAVPAAVKLQTSLQRHAAVEVQAMMIAILAARRSSSAGVGSSALHLDDTQAPPHEWADLDAAGACGAGLVDGNCGFDPPGEAWWPDD